MQIAYCRFLVILLAMAVTTYMSVVLALIYLKWNTRSIVNSRRRFQKLMAIADCARRAAVLLIFAFEMRTGTISRHAVAVID
jgi:hypothetical protein